MKCYYCDSQFFVNKEGYMQLLIHQIIRHGDIANKESGIGYSGSKLKE